MLNEFWSKLKYRIDWLCTLFDYCIFFSCWLYFCSVAWSWMLFCQNASCLFRKKILLTLDKQFGTSGYVHYELAKLCEWRRNLLFFESNTQRSLYGLEPLSYVICEPNAAQVTVWCVCLINMLHHQSKDDLLKSERLLWSLTSCTSAKKGVCVSRYRMKLIHQILKSCCD